MNDNDFLPVEEHFDRLVEGLNARDLTVYRQGKHVRVETAYKNRNFLVYRMIDGKPVELDRIIVNDFSADEERGTSTSLVSMATKRTLTIGYSPVRLLDYPVFMWLPLHGKLRWGATEQTLHQGSLAFPIAIRTRSRFGLRESNVIYCETGQSFGTEFDTVCAE